MNATMYHLYLASVLSLIISYLLLYQVDCADNPNAPLHERVRVVAGRSQAERFYVLYRSVFDPESPEISPEEANERLKDARTLLLNPNCHVDNRARYNRILQTFTWIPADSGCSVGTMNRRIRLEQQNEQHPILGPFVKFYNRQQFQLCTRKLDQQLLAESWDSELLANTRRVAMNIRAHQRSRNDNDAMQRDFELRDISKFVISYVEFVSRESMDKPANRPMKEQVDYVASAVGQVFFAECDQLAHLGQSYYLYQLMMLYDATLRNLFRPSVVRLLDRIEICRTIIFHFKELYPLARFDLNTLTEQIMSTEERDDLMNPDKMKDLLDISVHVGQAELILNINNRELMKRYIDYLAVSQIRVDKCQLDYIDKVIRLIESNGMFPNLINYLKQYANNQMIVCLRPLEFTLIVLIYSMESDRYDSNLLREVKKIFEDIAKELHPNAKFYEEIPDGLASAVLESYTQNEGIAIRDENQSDRSVQFRSTLEKLFQSCDDLVNSVERQANLFKRLLKLDFTGAIGRYPLIKSEMAKYNICVAISNLRPELNITRVPSHVES